MSSEALGASIGKIREVVHLNDAIPAAKFIDEPLEMAGQQNQPSRIPQGVVTLLECNWHLILMHILNQDT